VDIPNIDGRSSSNPLAWSRCDDLQNRSSTRKASPWAKMVRAVSSIVFTSLDDQLEKVSGDGLTPLLEDLPQAGSRWSGDRECPSRLHQELGLANRSAIRQALSI
jgi:hypothetical protein